MLKGLWKLTWVETKIFVREPMGVIGVLILPVAIFVALGDSQDVPFNVLILGALVISASSVTSLVAIIAIYREGGILKRLRATPLSPVTILGAQVIIKLAFTLVALAVLLVAAGRIHPGSIEADLPSFTVALLLSTLSILSLGFVFASVVPSARFAQPVSTALLYSMITVSGLFFPLERLPRSLELVARGLPTTHAVSLMQGIWDGLGWSLGSTAGLVLFFVACTTLSTRLFRWE